MPESEIDLVIQRIEPAAKGVIRLTLARPDGAELPPWEPGAHIDLQFTADTAPYVRQYSLCGRTSDRHSWQVAVLLVANGRGGSAHIHERFVQGQSIRIRGPRNNFPLVAAHDYLFIAGGIGITPILPMIAALSFRRGNWILMYSGRSAETMAFVDEVLALGADRVRLHESDLSGLADLAGLITQAGPETVIYCCGPESMLRTVEENCAALSPDRLHMERFSPAEAQPDTANTTFEVEFVQSGVVVSIPPDRSILDVASEAGVDIESSCQEGTCGTCETRIIAGTPDHRDAVLSAKERAAGKTMMVCVSRSCSARLVLDA